MPSGLITDPGFYAVAVPAVLLMAISKSGFGGGFGALAVPLLALQLPVPQAAALMLPLLAAMDLMGLSALVRKADWEVLKRLVPAGLVGTVLGALAFRQLSPRAAAASVGVLTLLFLVHRIGFGRRSAPRPWGPIPGFCLGVLGGFTSFVAHAGGPPMTVYLLPLRLDPVRFTATMAVLFAVINASKWVPYAYLGLFDLRQLTTALVLMPLVPLGIFIGLQLVRRIDARWFYHLVDLGMLLTALKLILF